MMNRNRALWVGLFVLAGMGALLILILKFTYLTRQSFGLRFYTVTAAFDNIGELKVRAPVTISGVTVGNVSAIQLDPKTFKAIVTLAIDTRQNSLPKDTAARILTKGLLGASYVALQPGFETRVLQAGDTLLETHSALMLESLVQKLAFNLLNKPSK